MCFEIIQPSFRNRWIGFVPERSDESQFLKSTPQKNALKLSKLTCADFVSRL